MLDPSCPFINLRNRLQETIDKETDADAANATINNVLAGIARAFAPCAKLGPFEEWPNVLPKETRETFARSIDEDVELWSMSGRMIVGMLARQYADEFPTAPKGGYVGAIRQTEHRQINRTNSITIEDYPPQRWRERARDYAVACSLLANLAAAAAPSEREPVGPKARLVYEKLLSLAEHEAMTGPQILDWLSTEHAAYLDDKGLSRDVIKPLAPYGLKNKPKIGYYISVSARPTK